MTFPTETEAREFLSRIGAPLATGHLTPDAVVIPTTHGHWAITSPREAEGPVKVCSICGESFREFANNARPINDGGCCAYCDDHIVTPARMALATEGQQ